MRVIPGNAPNGKAGESQPRPATARAPAIIVSLIVAAIVGLSLWYLVQPQPIVIQGEADAARIDIAARVAGRDARRAVSRGDNVVKGQLLFKIDNPELLTRLCEAEAALTAADAELAHTESRSSIFPMSGCASICEDLVKKLKIGDRFRGYPR